MEKINDNDNWIPKIFENIDDDDISKKIKELELDNDRKWIAISAKTGKNFNQLKEIIKKSIDSDRIINQNSEMM